MKEAIQKSPVVEGRQRNYGIDALRMLAMFMIVMAHILVPGGVSWAPVFSVQYEVAWFLEIGALCSVNCYALISGYVGVGARYKMSNLFWLWLRVVFYSAGITLIVYLVRPDLVTGTELLKSFFPVMTRPYWYFTSYFAMFFFIPLLNFVINNMEQVLLRRTLIAICIVMSGVQTAFHMDVFSTENGYSVLWLMILYLIGGYIRKYGLFQKCRTGMFLMGYLLMNFLTWGTRFLVEKITYQRSGEVLYGDYLINFMSPTILFEAIFLLLLFRNFKFHRWMEKLIRIFAPLAFSVYLIHVHPIIWNHFILQKFVAYGEMSWMREIVYVLATAAVIYVICSCVDLIRAWIFRKLLTFSKMFVKRQ